VGSVADGYKGFAFDDWKWAGDQSTPPHCVEVLPAFWRTPSVTQIRSGSELFDSMTVDVLR
jgi:hypothetical protein